MRGLNNFTKTAVRSVSTAKTVFHGKHPALEIKSLTPIIIASYPVRGNSPQAEALTKLGRAFREASAEYLSQNPAGKEKSDLVRRMVFDDAKEVVAPELGNMLHLMQSIRYNHSDQGPDEQLSIFIEALNHNRFEPAITAHPTDPRSSAVIKTMLGIGDTVHALKNRPAIQQDHVLLTGSISELLSKPILPAKNMTPDEEGERFVDYWRRISLAYREVKENIFRQAGDVFYNGAPIPDEKAAELSDAIKLQFQIRTWVVGDRDGNKNINGEVMKRAVEQRQIGVFDFFIEQAQSLVGNPAAFHNEEDRKSLQSTIEFWERNKQTMIELKAFYNKEKSDEEKSKTIQKLDKILNGKLPEQTRDKLLDLRDIVEFTGYTGIPPVDIREDVSKYGEVVGNLFDILRQKASSASTLEYISECKPGRTLEKINEMQQLFEDNKSYSNMPHEDKTRFLDLLGESPLWFRLLKENQDKLSNEAQKCFGCMDAQLTYPDTYNRDIMSEAKNPLNAKELASLHSIARYFKGQFKMGDFGSFNQPGTPVYLQETVPDLKSSPGTKSEILQSTKYRKALEEKGTYETLKGPSDNGARYGLMALFQILITIVEEWEVMEKNRKEHPELSDVSSRTFHGSGGDWKRQLTPHPTLHQTVQGKAAYDYLAKAGAMGKSINFASGQMAEIEKKAFELKQLKEQKPDKYNALVAAVEACTTDYNKTINSPGLVKLYKELLGPKGEKILNACNVSSRAGAKRDDDIVTVSSINKIRAISIVTYGFMVGINSEIIESVADIPQEVLTQIPTTEDLTLLRNTQLKILFAAGTTNYPRAWDKLGGIPTYQEISKLAAEYEALPETDKEKASSRHELAYRQKRAEKSLHNITYYSEIETGDKMRAFIEANKDIGLLPHELALGMMRASQDRLLVKNAQDAVVRFEQYVAPAHRAIDNYEKEPTAENLEIAVGRLRATELSRPWRTLREVKSVIHLDQESGFVAEEFYRRAGQQMGVAF